MKDLSLVSGEFQEIIARKVHAYRLMPTAYCFSAYYQLPTSNILPTSYLYYILQNYVFDTEG